MGSVSLSLQFFHLESTKIDDKLYSDPIVEICTLGGVPHVLLTSLAHEGRT
jgi:hypothetical protein